MKGACFHWQAPIPHASNKIVAGLDDVPADKKLTCGVIRCQGKFKIDETAIIPHELLHGSAAIAPGSMGRRRVARPTRDAPALAAVAAQQSLCYGQQAKVNLSF